MNPRVSRSSALASKATGFPIAKIAARLAVGYTLDEIPNDITRETPASFEPTIDYVVTKVPRWAFEKFPGVPEALGARMQSVGEAMAIGRTFPESLHKALRSLEHGRWGLNYIYGTWSVLSALNAAGIEPASPMVRKAVDWLLAIQNPDGGWGEDETSYDLDYRGHRACPSTASQTAWALIGLMAAGEARHPAVARGMAYLLTTQDEDGLWAEARYTATGFPRVFYLRYHGYPKFFPLCALARYGNLQRANTPAVSFGI